MTIFIQIGAGAGDLDYSADFREGFSRNVKSRVLNIDDRILVLEANPFNISTLTTAWRNYPQVAVFNLAILPAKSSKRQKIDFYYSADDGPFFQIASVNESHVRKHFPYSEVKRIQVDAIEINQFLELNCGSLPIELIAIDIEGLDLDVVESLDLYRFDVHQISFEKTHSGFKWHIVNRKLKSHGYHRAGMGMDPHNSDVLWVKTSGPLEYLMVRWRQMKHRCWEIQIPLRHYFKFRILKP